MEHKQNSLSRVKRHQSEKVLRFSIRKYSFGAASVAVAALMFLGARVASADSVSENTAPSAAGVVSPKDEPKSPQGIAEPTENKVDAGKNSSENQALTSAVNDAPTVDKAKLKKVVEELNSLLSTKLNLDDSVVSPVKDRLQKGKEALESSKLDQKDIDELVELLSKDVTVVSVAAKESAEVQVDKQVDKTEKQAEKPASQPSSEVSASEESQTVSAKKDSLKVSVDQLQAAVLELPEHETSKEVLEKANELLGVAQGVLENTTVSLNEVEEMTKRVKRMFNSVKIATMRLTSGSHDPRNGQNMGQGSDLRSAPIDKTTKQGSLGIVVADSGFITGYATPSSTIEIKRNGQKILTSKLDDTGAFKLNAPGIKVGDKVELVVNGQSVYNTTVSQVDTVSFNDSLAGIAQVDGYTATEADVEITVGGQKYKTKSQSNGYFTVNVDKNLMVKGATISAVVKKNGKVVGSGTSNVRETRTTDFGVGWNRNPMLNYSDRDIFSPDTKQYAFVSKGTADLAYDVVRVYREERIEKDGNRYYYWILDSGPGEVAKPGISKKISLAIPRTVGNPYDFTYTKYVNGKQTEHEEHPSASAWEYKHPNSRAYAQNGVRRSGAVDPDNIMSYLDYINPGSGKRRNIYRDDRKDGTDRDKDAASRIDNMLVINKDRKNYFLMRGVIEDQFNIVAGQRSIITFKTKILEGDELDQSIMSDWVDKDKKNPMLDDIKKRLANDPYLAFGGTNKPAFWERFARGNSAIIGTLSLKPEEAAKYNLKPKAKAQSTKVGVIPDAYNSIANPKELPAGTTYRWFKDPDVSKPTAPNQPVYGKVEVIIPERGTFIVDAPVHVVDDKAQTPVATAKDNGDVTAKPQDAKKVDKIKVSFTGEDNKPKTAEGTKGANGKWTVNNPDVRIDPNTGEITIPANKVKDLTEVTAVTKNGNGADSDPAKATAKDVQKPTLTITPSSQTVVEGEKVEFTVTAKDNTSVTLNAKDFLDKYFGRMNAGKATTTPVKTTETEKVVRISITTSAEDIGKQNKITFNAADNHGNNADPVNFNFTVTARDTVGPTITANGATVTKNEPIAPISVTAVDNPGGVGLRDKNPIEVTGLPNGLTFKDGRITGTPIAGKGDYPVTITAYDKNGNHTTSNITIKVQEQADKYNPTGETLTVNQGQAISDDAVKAKVKNFAPGRLTVESKPTSTVTAGKAGNAVVKVTYPDGSHDTVNVPVTVRDVTGPTIKAEETTVTKNEEITPIPITAEDNSGGVGMRDTNPITVSNLPSGLTFKDGKITGTTSVRKGFYTLTITAYDKNNTPSTKKVRINVQEQADKYTPTATELTVNQNEDITIEKLTPKVNNPGAGTLSLVSKPSTTTAGKAGNAVVKVTYSDGSHDLVNVPITVKDVTGPTITANNATVTNREDITPISVTAKDNMGGVGMRNTNPIVVTGLPEGLTYANGQITGKPTGTAGESTVTITAYDKNDNPSTTTIKITVQSQADAHNPRGERLTVDQNHVIEDSEVIAKVKDYAPATQLTVKSKPTTENIGNPADAVVTVTYPDGSSEDVNVPVTVRDASVPDTEGPTITANGATVTKNEPIKPILVAAEDNPGGVGLRDDNPIVVEGLPNGLTFKDEKITGTPTAPAGDYPVTIKAFDKKGNSTTTTITIKVQEQKDKHNPTAEGLTVNQGHEITDDEVKAKVKDYAPGTLTVTSKPSTATVENVPNAVVTVTYPDGSSETVDVPVTVKDLTGPKITADGATVTRNEPITPIPVTVADNEGGRGLREENPVEVTGLPDGLTYANGEITGTPAKTAEKGGYTVTIKATDKDGNSTEKQITITVQTQADKYTPKYDDGNGIPGAKVEVPVTEETGKTIPEGTKFESLTPGITVDDKGKVTVTIPEDKEPGDEIPGTIKVTYPDGSKEEVPVKVTVTTPDKDIYTPEYDKENGKPGGTVELPLKEKDGKTIPSGTKFQSNTPGITVDKDGKVTVTIPEGAKPGDKITGEITVTYPDGSTDTVPVEVTVTNQDKDIYTPEYDKENGKPGTKVEIPLKEEAGKTIPEGTKFESNTPGITVDKDGKVTVTIPEGAKPGDKITGEITVTYPDGSKDIVPVEVTVTNQDKDIYTPEYDKENGKPGTKVEIPLKEEAGKTIPEGTKFESNTPGITVDKDGKVTVTIPEGAKPGDKITGEITVTYPDGSKDIVPVEVTVTNQDKDIYTPEYDKENGKPGGTVELPLKEKDGKKIPSGTKFQSNTPGITVDKDGKVTVTIPEGAKPGDKITGEITVTYPDGSTDTVPVEVTVTNQDKDIYTPEYDKENGKPGTKVEIPLKEEAGKTIPEGTKFESNTPGITVDKDGKVTVTIPEGAKPGDKITGEITVTYPDGSKDIVPVEVTVTNQDKDIYTPEYDKENGKPGTKVEIPLKEEAGKTIPEGTKFESNTPGITVDKDGKVTVTIPEGAKPGDKITGEITVTYPDGSKDIVPVEVTVTNQDKDIYTPEYDKENGKPGTKVEIPLKEEAGKKIPSGTKFESNTPGITVDKDGKVTVTIPEGAKPGDKITGEITVTYPDGSTDIVPVEVTVTNQDKDIYTPEYDKENGKPGTKVEIPLKEEAGKTIPEGTKFESNTPGITVDKDGKVTVTIPEGAKPGDKITGEITVTYPDGSTDIVPVEVTVTNQDKDIYTPEYDKENGKPGTKVEIPLKEEAGKTIPEGTKFESNTPGITVDKDGKVTVTIPEGAKPGDKITGEITVTYPDGSKDIVPVEVTVTNQDKDIYTPEYDKENGKPGTKVEIPLKEEAGKTIPEGTKFESNTPGITVDKDGKVTVTIPEGAKPGDKITGEITVTYPDGSTDIVPVEVTVTNQDKDIYTPEYDKENGKPGTKVEIPLKEEAGKTIPEGTKFESNTPGITVDKDGKVTVTIPEGAKPGDKITGEITVTYPDGSKDIVPVEVTVTNQDKDIYTPEYDKENGKPGTKVEIPLKEEAGKTIPEGTKFESNTPGITVDKDGKVTVTIPEGAKPGDKITGEITVTYPDGSKDIVPVEVTVTNQDKDIYTPEYDKENGKPGGTVELPLKEKDGKKIPSGTKFQSNTPGITVDKDGKVTVTIPEGAKPGDKITGEITVTYPDGSTDTVPVEVTVTNQDKDIYTPEYDKENGKPGGNVELPLKEKDGKKIPSGTKFQSNTPGITVDKDGKVTVTIPEGAKPGDKITGEITVTYPDGSTDTVPVEVTVTNQDKDIYTPKYEDGNGKPGAKVEIPLTEESGKKIPEGTTFESDQPGVITVDKDGKVTVTIPEGAKPGDKITGKVIVRYPDGSTEEIPVTVTVTPNADQVDTKTTMDNGANSNDSQNVLPNTGTESNATLASLGLLGLLSGFGLVARKKKED